MTCWKAAPGADRFDASAGSDVICDFSPGKGDRIYLGHGYDSWKEVSKHLGYRAVNGNEKNDAVIKHADGSMTVILDAKGHFSAKSVLFDGKSGQVEGTNAADRIKVGYQDMDGNNFGPGMRKVAAGNGNDVIKGGDRAENLNAGNGRDKVLAGGGNDKIIGGNGADHLNGNGGNDRITAGSGNDRVFGENGRDTIILNKGNDKAYGGDGKDRIFGSDGHNQMHGGDGNDVITSGRHRDRMWGDAGNDRLIADLNNDGHRMTGGKGADTFVFKGADRGDKTKSVITDFNERHDRVIVDGKVIDLDHLRGEMHGHNTDAGFKLILEPGHSVLFDDFFL